MLLRKHIGKRLAEYYAQPCNMVVGNYNSKEQNIPWKYILGEWHWKRIYGKLHKQQEGQWMTPVELFKPHYSNIIGNFIIETQNGEKSKGKSNINDLSIEKNAKKDSSIKKKPVQIVEIGGGRGTNAQAILDFIQLKDTSLYERISTYAIFDSSPTLHQLQKELLLKNEGKHKEKIKLYRKDVIDFADGTDSLMEKSDTETIILALEVLDNLPHDKISFCENSGQIMQAEVIPFKKNIDDGSLTYHEKFVPLSDPLLQNIVDTFSPKYASLRLSESPFWIPSVAYGMLEKMICCRPNSTILIADFDWLPQPDVITPDGIEERRSKPADEGEPLITSMEGRDYLCYLHAPPLCDILFPTDFSNLQTFLVLKSQKNKKKMRNLGSSFNIMNIEVQKQADFLYMYGREELKKTQSWISGYSPLLYDFGNCSVLTTRIQSS